MALNPKSAETPLYAILWEQRTQGMRVEVFQNKEAWEDRVKYLGSLVFPPGQKWKACRIHPTNLVLTMSVALKET